jgi:hypothetical protein
MKVLVPKAILHLSIRIDMRYLSRRYLPMKKWEACNRCLLRRLTAAVNCIAEP